MNKYDLQARFKVFAIGIIELVRGGRFEKV